MIDDFRHKGLRNNMIEYLKTKYSIIDTRVLTAMNKVPRHVFLDSSFLDFAYQDKAFPIGSEQTISSVYTVAFQSELLNLNPGEKVLEIGTGSGYQTAVLVEMEADVYSIERHRSLYKKAKQILKNLNLNARIIYGDGYLGFEEAAPFDKILVTCGASEVPPALINQLKIGGSIVIPVGVGEQIMTVINKQDGGVLKQKTYDKFKFVPLLRDRS